MSHQRKPMKTQLQLLQEIHSIIWSIAWDCAYLKDAPTKKDIKQRIAKIDKYITQTHNQTLNEILALPEMQEEKEKYDTKGNIIISEAFPIVRNQLREQLRKSIQELLK